MRGMNYMCDHGGIDECDDVSCVDDDTCKNVHRNRIESK
jgi:hypothetical protein